MFSKKLIWGLFLIWNHIWRSTTESKKQKQKTKNKQPTLEVEARMGTLAKAWLIWCFSPFMLHPWELPSPKHLGLPGTQFANHWSQYHSFSIESVTVFFFFFFPYICYTSDTLLCFSWLLNFPNIRFDFFTRPFSLWE